MNSVFESYEAVIGIEIHVQLHTKNKIFCFCENKPGNQPNTTICEICCGYPGTLPLFNQEVLKSAVMAGLATNCRIHEQSEFARKHYFYADLPKGYQITQSDFPICEEGFISIETEDQKEKKIRIKRIHMEEDAGKNIHTDSYGSLVDYNRAGTPLLEIVTYPDISNAHEAAMYLKNVHQIMISLGITSGNMEEGAFRADTNISVRKKGETKLGTKCELKNINSFKFIKDATQYEIHRQIELIESGETIVQQTRLWDTKKRVTYCMREKETAADYRYLPDPDLAKIFLSSTDIDEIKKELPELPDAKKNRFMNTYHLSKDDATIIIESKGTADYFEETYQIIPSKLVGTWFLREVLAAFKENGTLAIETHTFSPEKFAELLVMIERQEITQKTAQDIFQATFFSGLSPKKYAEEHQLIGNMLSQEAIKKIIDDIFQTHAESILELKSGKDKVRGFLIGKIMAQTKGKADPKMINQLFETKLQEK